MAPRQWYIQYNDSVLGPFTSSQLRRMAERSQITPDVKVRVGEDGDWRLATKVKGLVINGTPTSDSMSIELSSEDIPSPEIDKDSSASDDFPSDIFEDDAFKKPESSSSTEDDASPKSASSSSFGEMPSEAPPIPGEVPVHGSVPPSPPPHGEIPVHGELPPPFTPGEMPSPPPPIEGAGLGWSLSSSERSERKRHRHDAIPYLMQELISPDEQVLYSAHPSSNVLLIQSGLTLIIYLFFGIIPSAVQFSNFNSDFGASWLGYSTILLLAILAALYFNWVKSCYVITNQRTFVKSGFFSVDVAYIYNANVQMLKIRTGIIDKLLHLNTIELRTSAGHLTLRWVPLTEVLKFYR